MTRVAPRVSKERHDLGIAARSAATVNATAPSNRSRRGAVRDDNMVQGKLWMCGTTRMSDGDGNIASAAFTAAVNWADSPGIRAMRLRRDAAPQVVAGGGPPLPTAF